MDNTQEAAGVAPAPQTEATPNTNIEQPAVDMHGFTSDQLADMQKFFDANGGFDAIKSKISNPVRQEPVAQPEVKAQEPVVTQPVEPVYKAPEGSITAQEFLAKAYFDKLAGMNEYGSIKNEIADGSVLKEMADFNIQAINRDGSINDAMVRRFLNMKAQTVVAKQTSTAPEASAAPTVDYIQVGDAITNMQQALAVIKQDGDLKSSGRGGHPEVAKAEEYLRKALNPNKA